MTKLAGFLGRRRRWVLAAWAAVLVLALPIASHQTDHLTGGGFDVPGSQSKAVSDSLERNFAGSADGIVVLLKAGPGSTPAQRAAAVHRVRVAVVGLDRVTLPPRVGRRAELQLRRTGVAMLPLRSDRSSDLLIDSAATLRTDLEPGAAEGGVTTYLAGQPTIWAGMQELSKNDLAKAEAGGFPIVALILLVVFGSLAAAALPLALGFVSVIITGALIYFISLNMETSVFVTNMASMIGIGVAIDYSLFILARYREERRAGRSEEEARSEALATSGLAVTFSGIAVIVSLAGLWMVDNQALRSMALGAMTVVAVSILTATTLLPALIAMLGDRVMPGGIVARALRFLKYTVFRRPRPAFPGRGHQGATSSASRPGAGGDGGIDSPFWTAWTKRVMAHPWVSVLGVSAVLLFLAIPVLSLTTGTQALAQFPKNSDVRVANELASKQLGGGADPVQIVAAFDGPVDHAAVAGFVRRVEVTPGVSSVAPAAFVSGSVLVQATPSASSESDAAAALLNRLRDSVVPSTRLASLATVNVGGETARSHDVRLLISGSMWKIVLFVLALSFLVLMVMLRSLLLPLKAVLMNLLSIGAAYGVLVAVFQWGWFDGLLGFESQGALDTINVPLIFAVVFGLSMDYEVFLMSRIRERYMESGDNERAVAEGLASSARTISSAALIMTCVFSVFVLTGVPSIKELGLGCAVAIALDATLVRLILVPAAMKLLGEWNWWMPSWLDHLLPDFSFESGSGSGEPEPAKA
ncbi:MAG TPA: MMPL family transporter [Solirubrobacterales bacterium]|nr:MMPL family transporter [Solirubrobacterales bacterium]